MTWRCASAKRKKLRSELRTRDGDSCCWCGKPMDFDSRDEPRSASIEHLTPRVDGGTDRLANLRLAHKRCNEDRSVPTPRRCKSPFYEALRDIA